MPSAHEAVSQAISFLTTPLSKTTVSPSAINILRSHLTASLLTLVARSPLSGISLRLAAASPPPECIGRACEASGVNWSEWLFLIGGGMGLDLDVNVTHTAVTASFCRAGTPSLGLVTVWQQEEPTRQLSTRELLYADDDSEELFNEINRSQHSPSWLSSWTISGGQARQPSALSAPVPVPKMQAVPMGARSSNHSRSSSYASGASGHSPNAHAHALYAQQQQQQAYYGGERAPSACSNHSSTSLSSSRSGRSSEDGSTGSSGALSWTRRGTVVPGPQQNAILAARQAHAQQQANAQVTQLTQQMGQLNVQQQGQGQFHRHSPSASITSLSSLSSSASGGSKHRRQRSRSTTGSAAAVVDPSKASVTAYDGGKTKVMTGGVMLGSITSGNNKKKRAY